MSTRILHLIIRGPAVINGLQLTADAVPRVNEYIAFKDELFRVTQVVYPITVDGVLGTIPTVNTVRITVI